MAVGRKIGHGRCDSRFEASGTQNAVMVCVWGGGRGGVGVEATSAATCSVVHMCESIPVPAM
jgi:hypothetical protein